MHDLILVVDPDESRIRRLREILSREGYRIMTAMDRETALQICQSIPVQLVLGGTTEIGFGPCLCTEKSIENKLKDG
jgi:PleD family two-component response regulator